MSIHRSWPLVADSLKDLINQRYGVELAEVCFQATGSREGFSLLGDRLEVSAPWVTGLDVAPPVGQVSSLPMQLQQPVLFGLVAHLFCSRVHCGWLGELPAGLSKKLKQAVEALSLIVGEAREVRVRPAQKIMFNSFAAIDLGHRAAHTQPTVDSARQLVEILVLSIFGRLRGGAATDFVPRRGVAVARQALVETVGEDHAIKLCALVDQLLEAKDPSVETIVGLARQWVSLLDAIVSEDVVDVEVGWEWVESFADSIGQRAQDDVKALQLVYPPFTLPTPEKKHPTTASEWVEELAPPAPMESEQGGEVDVEETTANAAFGISVPTSRYINYRTPTSKERDRAAQLTRTLKTLRHRTPKQQQVPSQTPHGRLNTRELVQMTAQRLQGVTITATPWARTQPGPQPLPELSCALVLDTSTSMAAYREAILSVNWAFAHATTAIGGKFATWGFGGDTFDIIRPGTTPTNVPVVVDSGATSTGSALALAQAATSANLTNQTGAKLAIVLTDGQLDHHGSKEKDQLDEVFKTLQRDGVTTIVIQIGARGLPTTFNHARLRECTGHPDDIIATIEEEIISTFAKQNPAA